MIFADGECPKCGAATHGYGAPMKCSECDWQQSEEEAAESKAIMQSLAEKRRSTGLTDKQLQEIEARAEKATKGPWEDSDGYGSLIFANDGQGGKFQVAEARGWGHFTAELNLSETDAFIEQLANASFIAHARDDIPAILAEIWRLREADRWIPVAERLPEKYKSVLVWMQHKSAGSSGYQVGVFANGCWFLPHGSDGSVGYPNNYAVTHWRPLPAPPNPPQ